MMCEHSFEISVCQADKGVRRKRIQGRGNSVSKDVVSWVIHHCQGDSLASSIKIPHIEVLSKNVLNEQIFIKNTKKSL